MKLIFAFAFFVAEINGKELLMYSNGENIPYMFSKDFLSSLHT